MRNWSITLLTFTLALAVLHVPAIQAETEEAPARPDSLVAIDEAGELLNPASGGMAPPGHLDETQTPAPKVSVAWGVTVASRYLFQGIDYSEGKVVTQPEVVLSALGFTGVFWANNDMHRSHVNELDFLIQRDWEAGKLSLSTGFAHYRYPNREGWDPTHEVYAEMSLAAPLNPGLKIHYDFNAGQGTYYTLGVGHELSTPAGNLALGANLFYQDHYYDVTGIPAFMVSAGIARGIGPFEVTPSISRSVTWENGDFRGDAVTPANWLFSIKLGQSF